MGARDPDSEPLTPACSSFYPLSLLPSSTALVHWVSIFKTWFGFCTRTSNTITLKPISLYFPTNLFFPVALWPYMAPLVVSMLATVFKCAHTLLTVLPSRDLPLASKPRYAFVSVKTSRKDARSLGQMRKGRVESAMFSWHISSASLHVPNSSGYPGATTKKGHTRDAPHPVTTAFPEDKCMYERALRWTSYHFTAPS